jgi:hypothetical protein
MSVRNLTILGATGTIGVNTLDVVARHPERFNVVALSGSAQLEKLAAQCRQHQPRYAVVMDAAHAQRLQALLATAAPHTEVLYGVAALEHIAALPEVDTVMAAIVGAAGLRPALAAAHAGKRILLANKETLVMAGSLFMRAVTEGGAELLPIDSEHNAIFQALPREFCGADRVGWPVPHHPAGRAGARYPGAGVRTPELDHGQEDFGRFRQHDEQGAGSDRSALAVQRGAGTNPGGNPPAKRGAFDGGLPGWFGHRATWQS